MARAELQELAMGRGVFATMAAVLALAGTGSGADGPDTAKPASAAKPAPSSTAPARAPAPKRQVARDANHWACDTRWMYTDDPASAWIRKCW